MTQSEWMTSMTDNPGNLTPAADVPDGSLVILRDLAPDGPGRYGVIMYAAPLTSLAVIAGRDVVDGGRVRFTVVSTGGGDGRLRARQLPSWMLL